MCHLEVHFITLTFSKVLHKLCARASRKRFRGSLSFFIFLHNMTWHIRVSLNSLGRKREPYLTNLKVCITLLCDPVLFISDQNCKPLLRLIKCKTVNSETDVNKVQKKYRTQGIQGITKVARQEQTTKTNTQYNTTMNWGLKYRHEVIRGHRQWWWDTAETFLSLNKTKK